MPKEGMLLDLSYTRNQGGEILDKSQSEAPTIFPLADVFPFAFSSTDGVTITPFNVNVGGNLTNDIRQWPLTTNHYGTGKVVMACTSSQSNCIALYSRKTTTLIFSHRTGVNYNLSMLTLTIDSQGVISDYLTHRARKIMAVGTPNTIKWVISQANSNIQDWGDL